MQTDLSIKQKSSDETFEEFSTTGIAGSLQGTLKIVDDSLSSEMREEPEGESPYDPAESESDLFLPRIDWDTLETSLKTRPLHSHAALSEDEERMRNLRSKLAQLGNLTSIKPELDLAKPKRRRARKPKNQMQVYFVSELSSESESETESDLCSEARRLEREARDAMEDAHRKAQAEAQHLKRDNSISMPDFLSIHELQNISYPALEKQEQLLRSKIRELNDELVTLLVSRQSSKSRMINIF